MHARSSHDRRALWLAALLLALGCHASSQTAADGETHFLIACNADDDCGMLAPGYACLDGFCRPTSATGDAGMSVEPPCGRGAVAGREVVVLGDVFIAQGRRITAELEALARQAGALSPAASYRDYSSATSNTFTLDGALLLDRYAAARAESDVKVVVMNGGGTDLLVRSCSAPPTPDCRLMLEVVDAANRFFSELASDGVEDIVFAFYPDPMDSELRSELHVLRPLLQNACAGSPVPCHFVALQTSFEGRFSDYMRTDYVPTALGAAAAASAIWSTMQQRCVAQ